MKSHKQKISHLTEIPDIWELSYPQENKKAHSLLGLKFNKILKSSRKYIEYRSSGLKQLWKCVQEQRSSQNTAELQGHYRPQETEFFVNEEAKRKAEAALLS